MRFWFDTEFIEDGKTIDLISIGVVAEDGREYYAISSEFDERKASRWVWENVFTEIPMVDVSGRKPRAQIRHELLKFIGEVPFDEHTGMGRSPEIWAWYGAYDWVVFCQLFGTMMRLPQGWPMYVRDVKQLCDDLGNPALPKQEKGRHHALEDAKWTKKAWEFLQAIKKEGTAR